MLHGGNGGLAGVRLANQLEVRAGLEHLADRVEKNVAVIDDEDADGHQPGCLGDPRRFLAAAAFVAADPNARARIDAAASRRICRL